MLCLLANYTPNLQEITGRNILLNKKIARLSRFFVILIRLVEDFMSALKYPSEHLIEKISFVTTRQLVSIALHGLITNNNAF